MSAVVALLLIGVSYIGSTQKQPSSSVLSNITQPNTYRVTKIHDGDTIDIDMDGHKETIRFIGVDTPETHDPRKAVQCFGQAASAYTHQKLEGKSVRLESDPLSTNRDRYDRLLRYVYVDDALLNAQLIKDGYAFAYIGFPFTKSDEFERYQKEARESSKGLWSSCTPTQNKNGGFTSNDQ